MKNYDNEIKLTKDADRTQLRNLPNSCEYCAYRMRPSNSRDDCSTYCKKAFK